MRRLTMAVAVAALMTGTILTAPTAAAASCSRYDLHPAFGACGSEGDQPLDCYGHHRQHGLRPRLVLARRMARMGVLPMLT